MTEAQSPSPAAPSSASTHTVSEHDPWTENVGDHPARADSPEYTRSRAAMIKIIQSIADWPLGPPPYQDHHAGSIPLHDGTGWLFVLDLAGSEWSGQFCLDFAKVDAWRLRVARIVAAFPSTLPALELLSYHDGETLLTTPITDATGVALWVDGIFNASLPVPAGFHTGVLSPGKQQAGLHHYPKPVVDIQFLKRDDFTLWVTDPATKSQVAVVPVAPKGSGDGRVQVIHALAGTPLHKHLLDAHAAGQAVVLDASHDLARQAFAQQATPPAA
ncbi:MAG: DUF6424 family protein [Candidatus Dormibacteria bacterium]